MPIISVALLAAGFALLMLGQIKLGEFEAEGIKVRIVGLVLMVPLISVVFLSILFPEGGDLVGFVELATWAGAGIAAYVLLFQETGLPSFNMPELQTLEQPNRRKQNFPSVMSLAEAARYLNVPEQKVIELINEGNLAAAKINHRYSISRTALDEFLENQNDANEGNAVT